MKSVLIISFILMFFYQDIFSQNTNYFPIAIGNEHQFLGRNSQQYFFGKIERDTIYPNGKKYFPLPYFFEFGDCRVDSSGNVLSISRPFFIGGEPEEYLLFKADAEINEVWPVAWNYNIVIDTGYAKCIYDDSGYVFGEMRRIKGVLIFDESYYYYFFWLAERIGLLRNQYDDGSGLDLNYAKINGIEYGTIVSVNEDMPASPIEFTVSQNYPNPFNGITSINIRLQNNPYDQAIKLIIYNILGSKVYDREYKANNSITIRINSDELNLSSGTYFYSIIYENKQIANKFLLLK